jgi:GAF domain-containing protein
MTAFAIPRRSIAPSGPGTLSVASFPILSENKLQGNLFVANRYRRKLSGRKILVLGSFAVHAGVAMRNARSFAMLSEALAEAERNRAALIDHIHRVDVSAAGHDEMASLLPSPSFRGRSARRNSLSPLRRCCAISFL